VGAAIASSTIVKHTRAVYMDAMAFGMGCCCLQVTFQARDLAESTFLYDQLHILSPLMVRNITIN
jgi:glutamate--cysteine ligase catalytic subunit